MKKRIISLLLAVVMILGMLPMTVMAEEACTHANTTESVVDNGDSTHTTTVTCEDCGETVTQDTITIDFKADFTEASEEDFWAAIGDVALANGGEVKRAGTTYSGTLTDEEKAAFTSLNEWLAANKGWSIDTSVTKVNSTSAGQRVYFNTGDSALWGLCQNNYFVNMDDGRSSLGLKVQAAEAGVYDLTVDFVLASTTATDYGVGADAGAGKVNVIVNGETVATEINLGGTPAVSTQIIEDVALVKGENTIVFFEYETLWGDTRASYRNNINLQGMSLVQTAVTEDCEDTYGAGHCDICDAVIGDCTHPSVSPVLTSANEDKTHNVTYVCDDCGAEDITIDTTIDFKADLTDASAEDFWAGLTTTTLANGGEVKRVGTRYGGTALTDDEKAAFAAANAWLAENKGWSIDTSVTNVTSTTSGQKVYFNTGDSALWGLGQNNYYVNMDDGRSSLGLKVQADEAGLYDLTVDFILASSSAKDYDAGLDANGYAVADAGAGYIDVIVNGTTVASKISLIGAPAVSTQVFEDLALVKGENSVIFKVVSSIWDNTTASHRSNINLQSMTLTQKNGIVDCADETRDGKCDVCDTVIGDCQHPEYSEVYTSANTDGTHNVTYTCDLCGAEEITISTAIDFKADLQKAAEQDFWAVLPTVQTANGYTATRLGGERYSVSMTADEEAAYDSLVAWLADNAAWTFNNANGTMKGSSGKRLYMTTDENLAWAMALNTYYYNSTPGNSDMGLTIQAPEAGVYDVTLDVSMQTSTSTDYASDTAIDAGGAYFYVYINGVQLPELYTNKGANAVVTLDLGEQALLAGANEIVIHQYGSYFNNGSTGYGGRNNINLIGMDLVQKSGIVACADKTGDGKCDTCGTVIGECKHLEKNEVVTANGDGTHKVTATCAACGEETCYDETVIDFKADFVDASAQSFWAGLTTTTLANGGEVKRVGTRYNGTALTDDEKAAFTAANAWLAENKGWSIDTSVTNVTSTTSGQKVYFNTGDSALWGLSQNNYFVNMDDGRSSLALKVQADEAGLYDLTVDFVLAATSATDYDAGKDENGYGFADAGAGYIDVIVNGTTVASRINLGGTPAVFTQVFEDLALVKGSNSVIFKMVSSVWDNTTASHRSNINLQSMTLTQQYAVVDCLDTAEYEVVSNGDETHTTTAACGACGAEFAADETDLNVIDIDFKDFVAQASQQEFWAQIPDETTVSGSAVKRIGTNYVSGTWTQDMTDEEDAAYDALRKWQEENLHWSFDDDNMHIKHEQGNMIFLSNDAALKWGVLHHSYFYNNSDGRSNFALTVIADEAGYYQLDMSYVSQGSGATDYPDFASVDAGGGFVDIFVNGELVVNDYSFKADNAQNNKITETDLATVYLQAGGNEIIVKKVAGYHGVGVAGYTGRSNAAITDLVFTELQSVKANADDVVTLAAADLVGAAVTVTADTYTAVSSNDEVATAAIDAEGNVVVTAVSDGQAEIAVQTIVAEGETATVSGQILVNVGLAVTDNCADDDGDNVCDICGGTVACKHPYTHRVIVSNGDETHNVYYACDICNEPATTPEALPCEDKDETPDGLCDWCGGDFACKHTNTSVSFIDNGDGTHEKTVICVCGEVIEDAVIEDCADEDGDGYCDGCEAPVEAACDHAETTSETVYNGDKTHTTTVTCVCGEVISTETADCVDEDKDCACDVCEGVIKTITKTTVAGSNMNLGNELQVNFIINDPKVAGDYVAYIHQETDDEGGVTYEIPSSDWEFFSTGRSKVGVRVRAMEMTDTLTLTIKDAE
ncbi:MAG: hypothetical protein J6J43_08415, partial [Oscillospiraceae bacterium]|nr:hypothetical protein [Oscillospiraceae bacterium]